MYVGNEGLGDYIFQITKLCPLYEDDKYFTEKFFEDWSIYFILNLQCLQIVSFIMF